MSGIYFNPLHEQPILNFGECQTRQTWKPAVKKTWHQAAADNIPSRQLSTTPAQCWVAGYKGAEWGFDTQHSLVLKQNALEGEPGIWTSPLHQSLWKVWTRWLWIIYFKLFLFSKLEKLQSRFSKNTHNYRILTCWKRLKASSGIIVFQVSQVLEAFGPSSWFSVYDYHLYL